MKRGVLVEADANVPSKKVKKSADAPALSAPLDRLIVFNLSPALLTTTIRRWCLGGGTASSNASLPGIVRPASTESLKFVPPAFDQFGPCWIYFSREKRNGIVRETLKLVEGGDNNDAPRWTFEKVKYYIYHLFALEAARHAESRPGSSSPALNPLSVPGNPPLALPTNLLYTVADLQSISASKSKRRADPKTLLHLCGNKWCMNPSHFFVGSKRFNDEQAYCHRGLHNAESLKEYLAIQDHYCKHGPKCWGMVYKDELNLTPGFCNTGLMVKDVEGHGS